MGIFIILVLLILKLLLPISDKVHQRSTCSCFIIPQAVISRWIHIFGLAQTFHSSWHNPHIYPRLGPALGVHYLVTVFFSFPTLSFLCIKGEGG